MHWNEFTGIVLLTACLATGAARPEPGSQTVEPLVEQVGEHRYRIGEIELDASAREIRFPAEINQREGVLEYILVHEQGKVHESLLRTGISPAALQVALRLLRFRPGSGTLFDHFWPPGERPEREPLGETLELRVSWPGRPPFPVREAILDRGTGEAMDPALWIYSGSEMVEGRFQAEVEGSIVAIYRDRLAMVNSSHPQAVSDENWFPLTDAIPPVGTPVGVTIRAHENEE